MAEWKITGHVAEHLAAPHVRIIFARRGGEDKIVSIEIADGIAVGASSTDGQWAAVAAEWVDPPPVVTAQNYGQLVADLSRLTCEAMDAFLSARKEAGL